MKFTGEKEFEYERPFYETDSLKKIKMEDHRKYEVQMVKCKGCTSTFGLLKEGQEYCSTLCEALNGKTRDRKNFVKHTRDTRGVSKKNNL